MRLFSRILLVVSILAVVAAGVYTLSHVRKIPAGTRIEYKVKPGTLPKDPRVRNQSMLLWMQYLSLGGGCLRDEPYIYRKGVDRIVTELPYVRAGHSFAGHSTKRGNLRFCLLKNVKSAVNPSARWAMHTPKSPDEHYVFVGPKGERIESLMEPDKVLTEVINAYDPARNPDGIKPFLTSKSLLPFAKAINSSTGPLIKLSLNKTGIKAVRKFSTVHYKEQFAILYDENLVTVPIIKNISPKGEVYLSGFASFDEAQSIAETLNIGSLPFGLEAVSISNYPAHYVFEW